jgi:hypothetical protein
MKTSVAARSRTSVQGRPHSFFASLLFIAILIVARYDGPRAQESNINAAGTWHVTYGGDPLMPATIVLQQDGPAVIATYGNGSISGSFNPELQLNATWKNERGNGWATFVFDSAGGAFHGEWGLPAKKASGTFIGTRVYPDVTNLWSFKRSGGATLLSGVVNLTQQGLTVLGSFDGGKGQLSGTFRGGTPLLAQWTDGPAAGWMSLRFAPDARTVSGTWGTSDQGQPMGSLVGAVDTTELKDTTGLWDATLTGQKAHQARLEFQQHGTSIVSTWPGGHISGNVPRGTLKMNGMWQTENGSGPIELTFSPDGNGFQGVWGYPGRPPKGRVLGTRVTPLSTPGAVNQ